MATTIRPELSTKNKYYIPRHRYYELKHFCMQFKDWTHRRNQLLVELGYRNPAGTAIKTSNLSDPTGQKAAELADLGTKIDLITTVAHQTDNELCDYILMSVTRGISVVQLITKYKMPCSRDTFYDRYRKFFWILDKER